jgi:Cytochrome bd terminal oxidase subunit I
MQCRRPIPVLQIWRPVSPSSRRTTSNTPSPICVFSMPNQITPTGAKSRVSCFILIPPSSRIALAARSRVISRARSGRRAMAIAICSDAAGLVMAFQFGTNWSVLSERTGPIQGPLLGYEGFTAFMLEATFFGVMLLGRDRVPGWFEGD